MDERLVWRLLEVELAGECDHATGRVVALARVNPSRDPDPIGLEIIQTLQFTHVSVLFRLLALVSK